MEVLKSSFGEPGFWVGMAYKVGVMGPLEMAENK